jgi:hypothetical protein
VESCLAFGRVAGAGPHRLAAQPADGQRPGRRGGAGHRRHFPGISISITRRRRGRTRALARELREVIAARHDRVLARWHEAGGCPLDLHRLVPIPGAILQLGDDAPAARQWLWGHWGTTQKLRQVRVLEENGDQRLRRSARVIYAFLSADWTPWQAIIRLRREPSLTGRCITMAPG